MTFHAPLDLTIHDSQGMYDSGAEHDACGVGMVTTLNKRPERKIVDDAIEVLGNLNIAKGNYATAVQNFGNIHAQDEYGSE